MNNSKNDGSSDFLTTMTDAAFRIQNDLGKIYRRVGEPVERRQKSFGEKFLEAVAERGQISYNELVQKFSRYAYAIPRIIEIEKEAGHIREVRKDVYELTERGQQCIKYAFGKKFFKLNE